MAFDSVAVDGAEVGGVPSTLGDSVTVSWKQEPLAGSSEGGLADGAESRHLAAAFKAVGHPVRLQILELLSRQPSPMCVCHIEARFTLSQPTISHHLGLLRKAGLVNRERRGTWIYYSAAKAGIGPLHAFLSSIMNDQGEISRGIPN